LTSCSGDWCNEARARASQLQLQASQSIIAIGSNSKRAVVGELHDRLEQGIAQLTTHRVMILIDARHGLEHFDGVLIEHIHAQPSQVLQASMALDLMDSLTHF
jgi:hypothetical protein